jgi:hypothetical protein
MTWADAEVLLEIMREVGGTFVAKSGPHLFEGGPSADKLDRLTQPECPQPLVRSCIELDLGVSLQLPHRNPAVLGNFCRTVPAALRQGAPICDLIQMATHNHFLGLPHHPPPPIAAPKTQNPWTWAVGWRERITSGREARAEAPLTLSCFGRIPGRSGTAIRPAVVYTEQNGGIFQKSSKIFHWGTKLK